MIIGITGKTGTGKSHVSKFLKRKLKFAYIDADKIKLQLLKNKVIKDKILQTFGKKDILHKNGTIDIYKLEKIITKDLIRMNVFSDYIDKEVGKEIMKFVDENENNYIIESTDALRQGIAHKFDITVLIVSPKIKVFKRLIKRYSRRSVENLWKWQKDIKSFDFVIENKTSINDLKNDVSLLVQEMLAMAKK